MLKSSIWTTRTSVAERSRGLKPCQLSKIPRRMRSPAVCVTSRAAKVMTSHGSRTRRARCVGLDPNFEPVIGTQDLERVSVPRQLLIADAFFMHPLDILVGIGRFVME